MRMLGIALVAALAGVVAQGISTGEAADKGKSPKKGGFAPDQATTMTAIALAESKKKKELKTKGKGTTKGKGGYDFSHRLQR
jgi:hypothetical protein